jgi:hypothetical protein
MNSQPTSDYTLVQVHGSFESALHVSQDIGRQGPDPLGELCAVDRGHLMAYGEARLRQAGGSIGNFDDG